MMAAQVLGLEGNNIKTEGGIAIAQGLALNSGLRSLNLLSQQQAFGDQVKSRISNTRTQNTIIDLPRILVPEVVCNLMTTHSPPVD
jgi:hypothetical protein